MERDSIIEQIKRNQDRGPYADHVYAWERELSYRNGVVQDRVRFILSEYRETFERLVKM